MIRILFYSLVSVLLPCAFAQEPRFFVGGGPGISILSGGSGANIAATSASLSSYEPKIGPQVHLFGGWNLAEYVSIQAAWSANRNDLIFQASTSDNAFYQQRRKSAQHNVGGDALLYFRNRKSLVRPFLSVGINAMWFRSEPTELIVSKGALSAPATFTARAPGLRVAAGTDLLIRNGWGFRYAFMEHLQQRNVIGLRLTPSAHRQLMNFQHLFGVVKYF